MEYFNTISTILKQNLVQASLTLAFVLTALLLGLISRKIVRNYARTHAMARSREVYIRKLINVGIVLILLISVGATWEISLKGLSIYFASIFTIVGVALFASWSILSNVTASLLLFFFFPYRIGGSIKIMDGDNSVEGEILDITLFYVKIKMGNEIIIYPNNQIIQKPAVHFKYDDGSEKSQ